MQCDHREQLLAEYRVAMADLTAAALDEAARRCDGTDDTIDMTQRIQDAIAWSSKARLDLRKHMEEHCCGGYSAWSALLWRVPRAARRTAVA